MEDKDLLRNQVDLIREVFHYARQFSGRTFVVRIDYAVLAGPLFPSLVKDLALLHESGIRIVVVPGAREWIDEVLSTYGLHDRWHRGIRIVGDDAIPFVKMAAFDVSNRVMTSLAASSVNAVIGNWVRARGLGVVDGVDYGNSGLVEKVQVDTIRAVLEDGLVPIFPCIGWSAVGKPYNISSDELSVVAATQLGAEKLFFITSTYNLYRDRFVVGEEAAVTPDGRLANFSSGDLERFLDANSGKADELAVLRLAALAARGGVGRVHILDGRIDGVILKEIFSRLGCGTMVYSDRYGGIRPMTRGDIPDALRIMHPFVDRGILLRRREEDLENSLPDYVVFDVDGSVHATAALHEYPGGRAEIAAVAVEEHYAYMGIGPKLVDYLLARAHTRGIEEVFILTTQSGDWFERLGFVETGLDYLPEERLATYDRQRRSRVLVRRGSREGLSG